MAVTREQQVLAAREAIEAIEGRGYPALYGCRTCGEASYEPTCERCQASRLPAAPIMLVALTMVTMTPGC